jgi:hypothetical protein
VLTDILGVARLSVPISGTLAHPRIDREAVAANLKRNLQGLGERAATLGVGSLIERLTRPRDPNAPAPLPRISRQERRQQRLEKKAEKRRQREQGQGP